MAGSVTTQATSPGANAAAKRLRIVEGHDADAMRGCRDRAPAVLGDETAAAGSEQHLVGVAVVAAVEHHRDRPPGGDPRQAHRLDVGGRRREGELPARQPVATAQLLGDPDRVFRRQEKLPPPRRPLAYRRRLTAGGAKPQNRLMSARLKSR